MSVPKNKQNEGELKVITLADELAEYTIGICTNEKYFPKRYRWCLTSKIVDGVIDICRYINAANDIKISNNQYKTVDWNRRRNYQLQALTKMRDVLVLMRIAYRKFGIPGAKINTWSGKIYELRTITQRWHQSDNKRYSN